LDHDAYGNLIFTGYTFSTDFTTTNAFDDSFNGYENSFGLGDAIVVKINPDGDELLFSTFFGGSGDDSGYDLTIDENNHIIVSGVTTSDDIPTSISSYFQDNQGGFSDILIFELSSDGSQLLYSTYFGGEGEDHGYYITNNSDNIVTFTGATTSPNFPVTDDAFNPVFGGGIWFNADNYITVLDISSSLPPEAKCKPATLSLGSNGTVTITPEDIDDGSTGTELSFDIEPSQLTCDNFGDNAVTLTVTDLYGNTSSCNTTVTLSGSAPNCGIAVSPSPAITNGQANTIYLGFGPQSLTLTASGGVSYEWSDGNSIISTNSSVSVSPTQTTTYTLTAYDSYSCSAECTVTIDVLDYTTGNNQMYICHRGTTQRVGKSSVQSHLNHGDYLGPCTNGKEGEGDEPETSEFTLSSNFPNPFSKSTMIEYTLPKAGFVQVKVFDVLSNEVAVLVNQSQAAGHYDIEFNGSGLTPGVYIVRIESQGKSDMMKIVKTE
jgi:hypothetical protein